MSSIIYGAHRLTAQSLSDVETAVNNRFEQLLGTAPASLDTLQELANALNNDADLATNLTNSITDAKMQSKTYVDNLINPTSGIVSITSTTN